MSLTAQKELVATGTGPHRSPDRSLTGWTLGSLLALGSVLIGHSLYPISLHPEEATVRSSALNPSPTVAPLQQFSAGGHILGFGVDQVYVASGNHALQVRFVDAEPITPQSDSASGAGQPHGVPALTAVRYPGLWPGVDLTYRAAPGGIAESVWRIAPGTDVARVRLRYNRPLALNPDGSLAIRYDTGVLNESAPVAWQERNGQRQSVAVAFALHGELELGFTLGEHDSGLPVWIDPTLTWHTFLGGVGVDQVCSILADASGNLYVGGQSNSTWGSPIRAYTGNRDAFLARLDSTGKVIWNTFLGGKGEDGCVAGIAMDGNGNIFVGGTSGGWGQPLRNNSGNWDAFVAKLDSKGTIIWNTFLGGPLTDYGDSLGVDRDDNVYIGGTSQTTWGSPVRTFRGGVWDAFAAKLSSDGALIWNTFVSGPGDDEFKDLAVDGDGNLYEVGLTNASWGSPLREYSGNFDAFVTRIDKHGALIWNTFLGSAGNDAAYGIALDNSGRVYVVGDSHAPWGSPLRGFSGALDTFVGQLDSNGYLLWNTFLGGPGSDGGNDIHVDDSGRVHVGGNSNASWGNPLRNHSGGFDSFAAELNSSGFLIWNTFLGGKGNDQRTRITVDLNRKISVAGDSNATWGHPVRPYDNDIDIFVAQLVEPQTTHTLSLAPVSNGTVTSTPAGIDCGSTCQAQFLAGTTVTLTPTAHSGYAFNGWSGACAGTGPCVVTMDGDKSVAATFIASPVTHALNLTRIGNGTVTSSPAGIDCGSSCRASFNAGTVVALTPSPGAGYQFGGWGGACSGTGACVVNMGGEQSVTAQFNETSSVKHLLKVARMKTGLVTSAPGGIVCGGQERACSALLSTVMLTAYPHPGYAVKDWVGCPGSVGPTCTLKLTAPAKVKARFVKLPKYPLKVVKTRNGAIISDPPGLPCGDNAKTCKARFVSGTVVSLTAVPKTGRTFSGWGGACSGTGTCTLTLDGQKVVEAAFE